MNYRVVKYALSKRAVDNSWMDKITTWWKGLSDDDRKSIIAGGFGLAGGSVIGGLAGGVKGGIAGGILGAGGAYAGRKWLYPYLMSQFKTTPEGQNDQTTPEGSKDQSTSEDPNEKH